MLYVLTTAKRSYEVSPHKFKLQAYQDRNSSFTEIETKNFDSKEKVKIQWSTAPNVCFIILTGAKQGTTKNVLM